ncbi:hypothetical protein B0H19DRAFT_176538 [Mycena capillaripes]|nr:hypothetical protein B0H19DRAFT_176538 [Mycena capillaripes]
MAPATVDLTTKKNLTALKNALDKAPKAILERSILEAAQSDGRVAKIFWDALVATDSSKKNLVAKFETCRHCKQGFDVTTNKDDSCMWHYGNLTIDEAVWVDHYEADGPIDTKENRKNLPQSFFWDCCGLQLNSEGCLRTKHASLAVLTRNGRVLAEVESERGKARSSSEIYESNDGPRGPPPSKKRKVGASADTKCRGCGELYDKNENTERVCNWHDLDAVRKFMGEREDWDSDEDGDQYYSENEDGDEDDSEGRMVQWTCCGGNKQGEGCIATPHLPPRKKLPKVEAIV